VSSETGAVRIHRELVSPAAAGKQPDRVRLDPRTALTSVFHPRRVAVYGASQVHPERLGNTLLRNAARAEPAIEVVAVHPRATQIDGVRAVASLSDPSPASPGGPVDLALISVPAPAVLGAVADAAQAGCTAAVVLSSGFAETGREGQELQHRLVHAAGAMRLIGPNCMGVVSDLGPGWFNGSYFWDPPTHAGPVTLISQSGAFGGMFLAESRRRHLGLARFASIGNAADLKETDLLEWIGCDPATAVVGMFLEGVSDGLRFVEAARHVTQTKPVVVLKAAKRSSGQRAAASHTGTLAGSHRVFASALRAAGVLEVPDSDRFFDTVASLAAACTQANGNREPLSPPSKVAIITVSGGPAVLAADAAEEAGLTVAASSPETVTRLAALVPDFCALGNPFDFTPQCPPDVLPEAVRIALDDPSYDAAVLVDCGLDRPAMAEAFASAVRARAMPAAAFVLDAPGTADALCRNGIPCFDSPDRAARSLGRQSLSPLGRIGEAGPHVDWPRHVEPAAARSGESPRQVIDYRSGGLHEKPFPRSPGASSTVSRDKVSLQTPAGSVVLSEWSSKALLGPGLPRPREELTTTALQGVDAARSIGQRVVAKASGVAHKSDRGLVRIGITPDEVATCWEELASGGDGTVVIAEMVAAEVELVVGGLRDPDFGPVVSVGFGGVAAEVLDDVCFFLPPVSPDDLDAGIETLRGARLLDGFRGAPRLERTALLDILAAVAGLLEKDPEVVEIDCNPVMVRHGRPVVVDALVVR